MDTQKHQELAKQLYPVEPLKRSHWTQLSTSALIDLASWFSQLIRPPEGWSAYPEPLNESISSFFFYDSFFVKLRHPPTDEPLKRGTLILISFEHLAFLRTLDDYEITKVIDANVQAAIAGSLPLPPGNQYPTYFFNATLGLDDVQSPPPEY